jgi:hypothetical protein
MTTPNFDHTADYIAVNDKQQQPHVVLAGASSKLSSPSRGDSKRIQGGKTRLHNNSMNSNSRHTLFASSHGGIDPLDHARNLQEGNRIEEIEGPIYTSLGSIDFVKNDKVFIEKIRKNVNDLKKRLGTIQADITSDGISRESSSFGIKRYREINRKNKNLRDEDLVPGTQKSLHHPSIKELETSTVLNKNRITLADGRFTTALAFDLQCNKISDEGVQSLCAALKVNNTLIPLT